MERQEQNAIASLSLLIRLLRAHPPPHRRGYRIRVAGGQQHLRLMGLQHPRGLLAARPPHKSPFRQPLLRQPEPLPVIHQNADRGSPSTTKQKQTTRERIGLELLLAQLGQRVDALASIHGLDRHQNPHLRSNLDHRLTWFVAPITRGPERLDLARPSLSTESASCPAPLPTRSHTPIRRWPMIQPLPERTAAQPQPERDAPSGLTLPLLQGGRPTHRGSRDPCGNRALRESRPMPPSASACRTPNAEPARCDKPHVRAPPSPPLSTIAAGSASALQDVRSANPQSAGKSSSCRGESQTARSPSPALLCSHR